MKHIKREFHRAAMERAVLMPSVEGGEKLGKPKWSARFRGQTGYWVLFKDGVYVRSAKTKDQDEAQQIVDLAQLQEDAREDNIVDCRRASAEEVIECRIKSVRLQGLVSAPQIACTLTAFKPHVEGMELRELDNDWVAETEEAMAADGYSYSYFRNGLELFRTGVREFCDAANSYPVLPHKMPPAAEPRKRVLSLAEQSDIVRWSTGSETKDPVTGIWTPQNWLSDAEKNRRMIAYRKTWLGLTFGSRAGIYAGLSYGPHKDGRGYFDLRNGVFHRVAPGTVTSPCKRSPPVDMPPEAVEEVSRWREMDGGCPWVFPTLAGGPMGQDRMYEIYSGVMQELGIEGVFAHVLRHTLITRLIEMKESAPSIAAVVGCTVAMIHRVYDHHDMGTVQRLAHGSMARMMKQVA